ncbi:MAG: nitrate reductase subunit beta, partial [Methyloceanibacter sp.]
VVDASIPESVGLSAEEMDHMYEVMAIANYENRFVIPTAHRELTEDAYDIRGGCGFSFGNGCSDSAAEPNMFGAPKKHKTPLEVA